MRPKKIKLTKGQLDARKKRRARSKRERQETKHQLREVLANERTARTI